MKSRKLTIHLGNDDDSQIIAKWVDQFFVQDNGKLGNNMSEHVKKAIIKGFHDKRIQLDYRYMTGENKEAVDAEKTRREGI